MDYKKHYDLLIERARSRQLTGYVERHHIVPKCMNGTNKKENIVKLTPEEHYVAHQLLVKIYPENDSLAYAVYKMTVTSTTMNRNNKKYGWVKRKYQSVCKKRIGKKNPSYGRSWYHCPDTFKSGKFLEKDIPTGWIKGQRVKKVPKILLFNKINLCFECNKIKRKQDAKQRAELLYKDLLESGLTPNEYIKQKNPGMKLSSFLTTLKNNVDYDKNLVYNSKPA